MAKLRLNSYMRDRLNRLARELVAAPAEQKALDAAYKKASVAIRKVVEKALPPSDMLVLKKYDKADIKNCIRLNLSAGGVVEFKFAEGAGPLAINYRIFNADEATTALFEAWRGAATAHKEALAKKLADYGALIQAARNLEDVVEVWPEADRLRADFMRGSVIPFSPDVVKRIRADVATRKAA